MNESNQAFVLTKSLSVTKALDDFHRVQVPETVANVLRQATMLWGASTNPYYNGTGRNPAPLPTSLTRAHMQSNPLQYFVTVKADGVRVQLLLCMLHDQPRSFFVTRDAGVYELFVTAPTEMFAKGVLIDGELAWQSTDALTRLMFLGFDTAIQSAPKTGELSRFISRTSQVDRMLTISVADQDSLECLEIDEAALLARAKELVISNQVIVATRNPHGLVLRYKPHYGMANIRRLDSVIPKGVAFDGLIFSADADHGFGRSPHVLKWKSLHTVDVVLTACSSGSPTILATQAGALVGLNSAIVERDRVEYFSLSPSHNVMVEWVADEEQQTRVSANVVLECALMFDSGMFSLFPLRKRPDKGMPNTVATVLATVDNYMENITLADIVEWAQNTR